MADKKQAPKGAAQEKGEVNIDFSKVRPFEPLNEKNADGSDAIYLTHIDKMEIRQGPKGKMAHTEFVVDAPEEIEIETEAGPETIKIDGRRLFREFSLVTEALPFLHELLRAADPDVELGANFKFKPSNYIGVQVALKVKNEEYQEQIRSKPNKVLPASAYKG